MIVLTPHFRHVVYFKNFNVAARFLRFLQLYPLDGMLHVFPQSPFSIVSFIPNNSSQCEIIQIALDSHKRFIQKIEVKPFTTPLPKDFK